MAEAAEKIEDKAPAQEAVEVPESVKPVGLEIRPLG